MGTLGGTGTEDHSPDLLPKAYICVGIRWYCGIILNAKLVQRVAFSVKNGGWGTDKA